MLDTAFNLWFNFTENTSLIGHLFSNYPHSAFDLVLNLGSKLRNKN